jgi:hypothetical protein
MAEETTSGPPGSVIPEDPEAAREEIRRTRQRMSGTIDEIEDLLVQRKEQVKAQLDVGARFRANPLPALGAVLGAGLLLGLVTGGRKHDRDDETGLELEDADYALAWQDRADTWEARSRRLLRVAREQEEEIAELRSALSEQEWFEEDELDEEEMSGLHVGERVGELRDIAVGLFENLMRKVNDRK